MSYHSHVAVERVVYKRRTMNAGEDAPVAISCYIKLKKALAILKCNDQEDLKRAIPGLTSHYSPTWPRYVLKTVDRDLYALATGDYDLSERFLGVCAFLVVASENERMERYLAGTDNPIHDLVHELRYNPNLPTEVRKTAAHFTEAAQQQLDGAGSGAL